ncbi:hypothetical protein, conserved [Eimeria maxima]|uniref:PH domain-containing protein n=1 Tax=Eimeria maxima TaxID=5804 RepID=U6MBF7_EIMMA|nr:hypothetical protein, conserved [Eimeria maxima]CDJ61371.1 hypothetical protein, conserved [Eimeria maxima]
MSSQPPDNRPITGPSAAAAQALAAHNLLAQNPRSASLPCPTARTSHNRFPPTFSALEGPQEAPIATEESEFVDAYDPLSSILEQQSSPPLLLKLDPEDGREAVDSWKECKEHEAAHVCRASEAVGGYLPPTSNAKGSSFFASPDAVELVKREQREERRDSSTDDSAATVEYFVSRSSSSMLPEGVSAVGEGKLVQLDSPSLCSPLDLHDIATAFQQTTDLAAAALAMPNPPVPAGTAPATAAPAAPAAPALASTSGRTLPTLAAGVDAPGKSSAAGVATAPTAQSAATGSGATGVDRTGSQTCMLWPFESGVRPWDDVRQDIREAAEAVGSTQLEDLPKKRIWVFHRGVCTPVSWYADTSSEDVKTAVLCACDVLADDVGGVEACGTNGGFCLRLIQPLPDLAEVDEEGLFREVKTLSFCCQLPSEKGVAEETVPSATTQQATDCPDAPTAAGETEADVPPETGAAATASATAAETGVCKEMSVVVTLGPRVFARDFGDLRDGGAYMLELQAVACPEQQQQQQELQLLRQQVGDKWRRLAVEVEPLSHIEAQKAVLQMRKGTNLLKHTRFGHPHLRQFQLSTDRQRLLWYTANKGKKASVVKWHELEGLVLGQKSANFEAYRIPALQHLSFSLVFKQEQGFAELAAAATPANAAAAVVLPPAWLESAPKTLDLTCKDEVEFDFWVAGCKALIASAKGIRLSKLQLLSHSRRLALERSETTVQLTKLPQVTERVGLKDCMDLPWYPPEELERKCQEQLLRVEAAAEELRTLHKGGAAPPAMGLSSFLGAGPAYATVLEDRVAEEDEETELERVRELVEEVQQLLTYRQAQEAGQQQKEPVAATSGTGGTPSSKDLYKISPSTTACPSGNGAPKPSSSEAPVPHTPNRHQEQQLREQQLQVLEQDGSVLAISSAGTVLRAGDLRLKDNFEDPATEGQLDLQHISLHLQRSFSSLIDTTAQAQQRVASAFAAAAAAAASAVLGEDATAAQTRRPKEQLPPDDVERLQAISQLLWRAEVDIENIEDMLSRLQQPNGFGHIAVSDALSSFNELLAGQVRSWGGQLSSLLDGVLSSGALPQAGRTASVSSDYSLDTEFN